jgi:hypothetical protein
MQAASCELNWNESQQCWTPKLDHWGGSTVEHIYVCGESAGFGGAMLASASGKLSGLQIAGKPHKIDPQQRDKLARRKKCLATASEHSPFPGNTVPSIRQLF